MLKTLVISSLWLCLINLTPPNAVASGLIRHGFRAANYSRSSVLLVKTVEVGQSIEAILQEYGIGYDSVFAPEDWSAIDYLPYDIVVFAIAGSLISEASVQAVRARVIDQGKRAVLFGAANTPEFILGINQWLVQVDIEQTQWSSPPAPHWTLTLPEHPLARLLPAEYTFINSNAAEYCLRVIDPALTVVACNGDNQPCFFQKQSYPAGGDLLWFINDPTETVWTVAEDYQVLRQIVRNCFAAPDPCRLVVIHTCSLEQSVFRALDQLGYVYDSIYSDAWEGLNLETYDMVIAALDGGSIELSDLTALKTAVVDRGQRLMLIGGVATASYVQAVHAELFACDLGAYSWQVSPEPHISVTNSTHFLVADLPSTTSFSNELASRFQLRVRDGRIAIAARNGLNETILFSADFYGSGDIVYFSNSPRSSYWTDDGDFEILKLIIANSIRCGGYSSCRMALISDQQQLTAIQQLVSALAIQFDEYPDNLVSRYTENAALLAAYDAIVWYQNDRLISQLEYQTLEFWVLNGGKLMVTGFDSLGSPTDLLLRDLIRSSSAGDGPFNGFFEIQSATHPIVNGPYGAWVGGTTLRNGHSDHDQAKADPARGAVGVATLAGGVDKIVATEAVGNGGKVVYWNGNLDCLDWTDQNAAPDCRKLLKNTLHWLCSIPTATPTVQPPPAPIPSTDSKTGAVLIGMISIFLIIWTARSTS